MIVDKCSNGVSQMQDSDAGEIIHLFEIMQIHETRCSLEFQSAGSGNPIMGASNCPIRLVEHFECKTGPDSLLIELGGMGFNFELETNRFKKAISETQVIICVYSELYCAWFSSDFLPPDGVQAAKTYRSTKGGEKKGINEVGVICHLTEQLIDHLDLSMEDALYVIELLKEELEVLKAAGLRTCQTSL